MAGYEAQKEKVAELGATVIAASVNLVDDARTMQARFPSVTFLIGVTQATAAALGAWWQSERGFIQPAEFIVTRDGRISSSTYNSGPIGRLRADEALQMIGLWRG